MNTAPAPLSLKPDLEDAVRRWDAYFAGAIIDRPLVCVTAPQPNMPTAPWSGYRDRVFGDIDDIVDRAFTNAQATYYGGEAIPAIWLSFGPDEISAFCGAELAWSEGSGDTNWSVPFVERWEDALPLRIDGSDPLWQRMLRLYEAAAERLAGHALLCMPDLHTNMDLLAAVRGPERLCTDLIDQPEMIDRAMADTIVVFRQVWDAARQAGRMDVCGYGPAPYSMEGGAVLQCDFSCMMSPAMFDRWVLPALEEEASIVRHVVYHWDGPDARVHTDSLVASAPIQTLSYVPGDGRGTHIDYVSMYKSLQARGKAVQVGGSIDEVRLLHQELAPELTMYCTYASSPQEADELLEWFVRHT